MSPIVKIVAYIGLAASAVLFGFAAVAWRPTMGTNGALCFFSVLGIGLLAARDISSMFAEQSVEFLLNEEQTGLKDPEYQQAEEVWKSGDHLEAIKLMRIYYEKNPGEVHALIRIAEIYETDIGNYLAAVLEYEEILKKPLDPERWGWRAIHLCNLYNKINKPVQSGELLERIAKEYPHTGAAKKARSKLGLPEPEPAVEPDTQDETSPDPPIEPEEPPISSLPPGFRPKK